MPIKDIEKRKEYMKKYLKEYSKKYILRNREKLREYQKNYYSHLEEDKKKARKQYLNNYAQNIYRKRHPEKYKARCDVYKAIRNEQLLKPESCTDCNAKTKLTAHHSDYSKPLEVIWLCWDCHCKIHEYTV